MLNFALNTLVSERICFQLTSCHNIEIADLIDALKHYDLILVEGGIVRLDITI